MPEYHLPNAQAPARSQTRCPSCHGREFLPCRPEEGNPRIIQRCLDCGYESYDRIGNIATDRYLGLEKLGPIQEFVVSDRKPAPKAIKIKSFKPKVNKTKSPKALKVAVLSAAGKKGGKTRRHQWTEDELAIVRRDYRGTNASAADIAVKLGVTRHAVKGQCAKMGILTDKSPQWTGKELRYLEANIHRMSVLAIARKLHRSVNAVKVKATRLQLGIRQRDGWYTKREASEILGVDHKWLQVRIDAGRLKASWHHGVKPTKNGMSSWHIDEYDLRDYIINHTPELTGRNVDLVQIVHLLMLPVKKANKTQEVINNERN